MNVNVDSTILIAQRFGRVSSRAMFGGTGIFCNVVIFAVARDEHVFLRAGDSKANWLQWVAVNANQSHK